MVNLQIFSGITQLRILLIFCVWLKFSIKQAPFWLEYVNLLSVNWKCRNLLLNLLACKYGAHFSHTGLQDIFIRRFKSAIKICVICTKLKTSAPGEKVEFWAMHTIKTYLTVLNKTALSITFFNPIQTAPPAPTCIFVVAILLWKMLGKPKLVTFPKILLGTFWTAFL